ncbi:MAG: fimbrial assembly protein [Cyanobacteria bacterium]|nr:fimbrial assembly protein [Cyanobacteria bacterium CG_2015-16_32_12]NCO78708.1 fimbrial assembly protein [Cyanobacteria bacterium CG_2015-22_32_23]NCQ04601.1 fimbrial assembly protein [Cyanobacteria bacterium CG_2015-09_32_10]NCS85348.1 fimbrial assembly protein [Cyanobacteria bacterium CG_2015-02_32_10]
MYKIDINFLKDRKLDTSTVGTTAFKKKTDTPLIEKLPILIGAGVAVAFIAATGGALFFLNNQKTTTASAIAQLDAEIQRLQGQNAQVNAIKTEIDGVNREIGILASVFNQIKPWSAMLSEIGSVTPPSVQIQSISQSENKILTIAGYADSYDNVNDFVLTLKNSRFLDGEQTKLTTTSLADNPSQIISNRQQLIDEVNGNTPTEGGTTNSDLITLPQVVSYSITAQINDKPSEELLNVLNSRGAIGLVSRLTNLQRKGALKLEEIANTTPTPPTPTPEGETKP